MIVLKYIIAIIAVLLFCILIIFIVKKVQINKIFKSIIIVILLIVTVVSQFVILRNDLLTYSSPASALAFCNPGETIKTQVDVDGGAFLICNAFGGSGTTIRTALKRDGRWSSIDLNNGNSGFVRFCEDKDGLAGTSVSPGKIIHMGSVAMVYNFELNKSIIQGVFTVDWENADNSSLSIEDLNGNQFIVTHEDDTLVQNGVTTYEGYMIIDGEMSDSYTILIDGFETEVYCGGIFP